MGRAAEGRTDMRHVLACIAAVVLVGCSGATGDATATPGTPAAGPATPAPAATPTSVAPPAPSAPPTPQSDVPALTTACVLTVPDRDALPQVRLAHPAAWLAPDGTCGFFDPRPASLPPGIEAPDVDVRWKIDLVPFAQFSAPSPTIDVVARMSTTVAGRPALRTVGTATGEGFFAAGTETITWAVELSSAPGRQATLVGSVADVTGVDYRTAVGVLDAMAARVVIADRGAPSTSPTS